MCSFKIVHASTREYINSTSMILLLNSRFRFGRVTIIVMLVTLHNCYSCFLTVRFLDNSPLDRTPIFTNSPPHSSHNRLHTTPLCYIFSKCSSVTSATTLHPCKSQNSPTSPAITRPAAHHFRSPAYAHTPLLSTPGPVVSFPLSTHTLLSPPQTAASVLSNP